MNNNKIKVGFISEENPNDRKAWSGSQYKLYESISQIGVDILWIPVKRNLISTCYMYFLKMLANLFKKNVSVGHTTFMARILSNSIDEKLVSKVDVLFSGAGSQYLYSFKTEKPILYLSDATFKSLYNYYPEFSNFFSFNVNQGNKIEKVALSKASKIIHASNWAKESAVNDYGIFENKISVIEFGANIDEKDLIIEEKDKEKLNILFLGVDWERKGGDVAVSTCKILNEKGVKSVLHIVGIKELPSKYNNLEYIDNSGFLNKNIDEQYSKLTKIISKSDLLLLPTRAECAGIAFAEASAYGLPIFTYDTGGILNYVENGVNGYRLDLSCNGSDFANKIIECIKKNELEKLSKGCKKMYYDKLNWKVWSNRFENLLKELNL